jgi:transcriptional regulator
MYTSPSNVENRLPVLHDLIAAHPLAAVVTLQHDGLEASHIPLQVVRDGSPLGVLRGHVARANAQWKDVDHAVDALAIFSGPHHYISAGWYPDKHEHGKEVPTWNYVTVHATGPLRIVHDPVWLLEHLTSLTDQHEAQFEVPWKVSDAPASFVASMMKAIVGFEIPIRRLEGKWKVSQNRTERDRLAVIAGLAERRTVESGVMGTLVKEASTNGR